MEQRRIHMTSAHTHLNWLNSIFHPKPLDGKDRIFILVLLSLFLSLSFSLSLAFFLRVTHKKLLLSLFLCSADMNCPSKIHGLFLLSFSCPFHWVICDLYAPSAFGHLNSSTCHLSFLSCNCIIHIPMKRLVMDNCPRMFKKKKYQLTNISCFIAYT